jgi:uncharacterized protein
MEVSNKKRFLYKLVPPRTTFVQDMTEAERKAMVEHAIYWKDLTDKGIAIVFGLVLDPNGPWGVAIVEVEDESKAHDLGLGPQILTAYVLLSFLKKLVHIGHLV